MKKVILTRTSQNEFAIYGVLMVVDGDMVEYVCRTIENRSKSFPEGTYPLVLEYSPRFKTKLWELKDIFGRGEIKIHVANYYTQLDGCIAVGRIHQQINDDGVMDLAQSKVALEDFMVTMQDLTETTIDVIKAY